MRSGQVELALEGPSPELARGVDVGLQGVWDRAVTPGPREDWRRHRPGAGRNEGGWEEASGVPPVNATSEMPTGQPSGVREAPGCAKLKGTRAVTWGVSRM